MKEDTRFEYHLPEISAREKAIKTPAPYSKLTCESRYDHRITLVKKAIGTTKNIMIRKGNTNIPNFPYFGDMRSTL